MAKNVYEGLFLFDSNRYSRDPAGVSGQIAEMLRKHEGELLASRMWEERRLAYSIKGHRKGTYWLAYFRLDGNAVAGMVRDCRISDTILRSLILKVEPRIVDVLVSHAEAGHVPGRPKRAEAPAAAVLADVVVPDEAANAI